MIKPWEGPFGAAIQRHLALRHSLGFILQSQELTLRTFDQYTWRNFPKTTTVTRDIIIGFLHTRQHLRLSSRHDEVCSLRQFCRFLFQQDPNNDIPEKGLLPPIRSAFRPHIYTHAEAASLLHLARQLLPAGSLRPLSFTTLIGLLWSCGLRVGEALRLNLEDVDLQQGVLCIRQTKNFKSRLVPLSCSTAAALAAYREQRLRLKGDQGPMAPFFMNQRGRRFAYETVQKPFQKMIRQLGLNSPYGRPPRLHDLRHSFATRTLFNLYKTGKDPTAFLPVLATYLGHVNVACTTVYLHPSIEVLEIAGRRFGKYIQDIQNPGAPHENP